MAGIDTGGGNGGKRPVNSEIPLIPFIDFLLCLVAFLLVTAVWNQMATINASALVPQDKPDEEEPPPDEEKPRHLHVEMKGEDVFQLQWKEGQDVVGSAEVPREKITGEKGAVSFPALGKKIKEEWAANGTHKGVSDLRRDQAVLHTDNSTEFAEIIAVIDAIYVTQRDLKFKEKTELVPAFNVTFAVD